MQDFEKLGVFYLGRKCYPDRSQTTDELLLYDAKDLTTHGVIVGMTGSGKTGLALALLEEAALDGIPAILIDPKGDLANLLLGFPNLQPSDFRPWIDEAEAARKGMSPDAFSAWTAETWRKGLADWGQDGERIRRMRESADLAVYTPGNSAGRPLQILRSFTAPSADAIQDAGALRDRIQSAVSGLLGLIGINGDPVQSREHVLLSNLLERAWREGRSLDLAGIIGEIQKPPFDRIGVFDLESFYPATARMGLALALNNLIASPGFSAWIEGEPLDIQRLLYTPAGKPRISVLYLAHLSDAERMFFVTLLLSEILAWTRAQAGTGSLRALLYMDEIYGYFPPTANPPSKVPMLTLLKQARAYGLGIVLSTQNPVDLDYKGLANAGTWWIGRLQTERDKLRVLEGLEGAMNTAGAEFDRPKMERTLAGLSQRVFLMRNVHDDQSVVFQSRWALSYLRGPLTLPQIRQLTVPAGTPAASPAPASGETARPASARPVLPAGFPEVFLRPKSPDSVRAYRPAVVGVGRLHFVDARSGLDAWETYGFLAPLGEDGFAAWEEAEPLADPKKDLEGKPQSGIGFESLTASAIRKTSAEDWKKTLSSHLYQNVTLARISCPGLKMNARPGESEGDFRARVDLARREKRDEEVERLKARAAPKLQTLQDQLRRARERVEREKAQSGQQKMQAALNAGATLLGALLGRRAASVGTMSRAASTVRSASRIGKEARDVEQAGESVAILEERLRSLSEQFDREAEEVQSRMDPACEEILRTEIRPRKSDILIGTVGLCWVPVGEPASPG
jgi:hypothetical protein